MSLLAEVEGLLAQTEITLAKRRENRWIPHTPTPAQAAFLEVDEFEALYGGAAGGGKSDALLMDALRDVDVPGYSAILFRLTYQDLSLPGALMDRAATWLRPTAAHWNDTIKRWTFPSGAVLSFGYLQHEKDVFRYQSAEFQMIGFDELTQFSESKYTYLLSRCRRRAFGRVADVGLRVRSATNPGGVGHRWVARRFGINEEGEQDREEATNHETGQLRVFVPAKLADNPHVDREAYGQALANLDRTRRDQLRDGRWVQDSTGLVCPIGKANLSPGPPVGVELRHILSMDMGSSETKETLSFSVLAWSPEVPRKVWLRHSVKHRAMLFDDMAREYWRLDRKYGLDRVIGDAASLGAQFVRELRRRFDVPIVPAKKKDRLGWVRLFRDAARAGDLLVVDTGAEDFLAEVDDLQWAENGRAMVGECHCYDGALYAYREARAWAAEEPEDRPAPGTAEAARLWEIEQEEREERAAKRNKGPAPFWK